MSAFRALRKMIKVQALGTDTKAYYEMRELILKAYLNEEISDNGFRILTEMNEGNDVEVFRA